MLSSDGFGPGPDERCPGCRRPLPGDARFCASCGTPRADPRGADTAGRKIVTVLFCDLVGSTALSGTLDPEALRGVTLRYFDAMRAAIEEHGGTVEKFIGDAVMAVFGVPSVREDDARRALAAALGMLAALRALNAELDAGPGVRLAVRIGVNTGRVVTGSDASARQALVSGEVVNVAARLEQNAGAGEVLIGPDTLRAAGPGVRTAEVGPLRLKGKAQAVTAHRLLGLDGGETGGGHRSDLPFVGRDAELSVLDAEFGQVTEHRSARLVVLGGEPGQGKTRLLRHWLERPGPARTSGIGRCRPTGEQAGLQPLADAVAALLAGSPGHPHPPGLDVLAQGLLADGTPTPSLADTCAALVEVLGALAAATPLVLVVDDAHRAAALLLDLLDRVVAALTDAPVLVALLGRPELLDARPAGAHRVLALGGLPDREALRLVEALGGSAPAHLLERAGGNPLHLEQLLAAPAGAGGDGVPLTLQTLIGARLDALDPAERRAVDLACVLGREFAPDELAALDTGGPDLSAALRRLGRHRLVVPDGAAFRFASGVVQEVAYECLSKQGRAERHERAAGLRSVRSCGPAAVGGHLERAHRYRAELGLHGERTEALRLAAARALAEAGARAAARTDPGWAVDLLTRATGLLHPGEDGRLPAARRLGEALLGLGRIEPGRALLAEVGGSADDPVEVAHARLSLAALGQQQDPAPVARQTLPVFEQAGDELGQARACLRLAQQEQTDGRHAAATRLLGRAVRHAERAGGEQERASALGAIGVSLWRGPVPAPAAVRRCRELLAAQGRGRRAVAVTLNCPLAVLLALADDEAGAAACLAEAGQHAERLGYAEAAAFLPLFGATVAALGGRAREALELLAAASAAARELGGGALLSGALLDTARLHLDLDEPGAARSALAALERERSRTGGRLSFAALAERDGLRARLAAADGDRDGALVLARGAVAEAGRTDSPILQGLAAADLARTAALLGLDRERSLAAAAAGGRFAAKGHGPGVRLAGALAGHHPRREAVS
ncbi:adenylate/guanylate cyclase domain-containing protein [Kitasatospora sp. NPDC059646]|uniref:adenylate/guanylate cyclase domain-containing protein n=1 Tax=Kitasatospora sp. NPDC059646 TaxID=3346893 RepID=UPI0036965C64